MCLFSSLKSKQNACMDKEQIGYILDSFKFLRIGNDGNEYASEMRNASIHIINGYKITGTMLLNVFHE